MREFRYTFDKAKGKITVPASLTATATRAFTFLVTLEMKSYYGKSYKVKEERFEVSNSAEVQIFNKPANYKFNADQGFKFAPQLYRPNCTGTEPFDFPSTIEIQCRIYDDKRKTSLAFSKGCLFGN